MPRECHFAVWAENGMKTIMSPLKLPQKSELLEHGRFHSSGLEGATTASILVLCTKHTPQGLLPAAVKLETLTQFETYSLHTTVVGWAVPYTNCHHGQILQTTGLFSQGYSDNRLMLDTTDFKAVLKLLYPPGAAPSM